MSSSRKAGAPSPEIPLDAFRSMTAGAEALQPLVAGASRVQLEIAGFATSRARALFEAQATLMRCRTPQDVMQAQIGFWRDASRDWMIASRRIGEAWQSALSVDARHSDAGAARRDYIDLAGGVDADAPPPARNGHAPRRSADRRAAA